MLTILGLRPLTDKYGVTKTSEVYSDKGWRAIDIREALTSKDLLAAIPKDERWNLFFTVHHVIDGRGRPFERGYLVYFDIDKIAGYTHDHAEAIGRIVAQAVGADFEKCAVVSSGNGVHIYIQVQQSQTWTDPEYFEATRFHYKACCDKIGLELAKAGFTGTADPSVWDRARIMRLPGTENRKDKGVQECRLIKGDITPQDFSLEKASGVVAPEPGETLTRTAIKNYPDPDTQEILNGCGFLKWTKENQAEVTEPEWYAALSILGRASKDPLAGARLAHEYSCKHPSYTPGETDMKLEQAMAFGPRTCQSINHHWRASACKQCPHWGKIVSPIMIQGENYIRTKETGFHFLYPDPKEPTRLKVGKPDYEGLRRFWEQKNKYIVMADSETMYTWNGTHWDPRHDVELKSFAQDHFEPLATTDMVNEFSNLALRRNLQLHDWFVKTTSRKMNFQNGVLDLETMQFSAHSRQNGFRSVLPYAYDPDARAPRFEKFMQEVMLGREELIEILLQFAGYSLANDDCWEQKCVVLQGLGSNGKSRFVEVLMALAGEGAYTAMTLEDLHKDTNRYGLDGALFNISEETPGRSLADSSLFKNLVSGGSVMVKQLYKQPYAIKNRAKLWLLCNEIPKTSDMTHGMFRRLVIVPFDAQFEGANKDKHLREKLLAELPGILNLALTAYARMKKNAGLQESAIVQAKLEAYREEVDTVIAWWKEAIEILPESAPDALKPLELYEAYVTSMDCQNEKPVTFIAFVKRLSTYWPAYNTRSRQERANGEKARRIHGIRFKKDSMF